AGEGLLEPLRGDARHLERVTDRLVDELREVPLAALELRHAHTDHAHLSLGHAGTLAAARGRRQGYIERALPATCDHLLWGAAHLDVALAALVERTAVHATVGGQHPDLGTHNAIAALGRKRFLEVIAPDPALQPGALARRLAALSTPTLIMWA